MTAETITTAPAVTLPVPVADARMSAGKAVVAVAVLITLTAAVAVFIGKGNGTDGDAGDVARMAAPFTLPELRAGRGEVSLTATPGRPTVVNFFGAYCEPCKRELPQLKAAASSHPEVAFIGVDHQDSREDAIELLDRFAITYPAGYDPRGEVAARYSIRGMPATLFIHADGRIADVRHGEMSAKELRESLEALTLRKPRS